MKEMINKIKLLFGGSKRTLYKLKQKSRAQSMVEFALLLPILILLLLVMVELGFALNAYLSLLDSTRQAARVFSNADPFLPDLDEDGNLVDNPDYYTSLKDMLIETLDSNSYKIEFDTSEGSPDNILISVVGVDVDTIPDPDTIAVIRHPEGGTFWVLEPDNITPEHTSHFEENSVIEALMTKDGSTAVDAGLLIVEIYYGYEGALRIPGFLGVSFATEENPFVLYASTIMPIGRAKP